MVTGPGHGFKGWLGTQVFDPNFVFSHDPQIVRNLLAAALQFPAPSPDRLLAALDDEVGYLSYDARYADLLFEVITRRYPHRPVILTGKSYRLKGGSGARRSQQNDLPPPPTHADPPF